jgi:hypothetical protein
LESPAAPSPTLRRLPAETFLLYRRSATVEVLVIANIGPIEFQGMPEVLRVRGYRFFFFSREGHEPRHIHVEQAERYAKFWLEPIELVETRSFRGSELRELYSIIEEHRERFIIAWDEHFSQ